MQNAFKKAFTGAVAVLTIVWSVGLANLPMAAQAATAGDVVKGTTLSTLYYVAGDGSRYAFPNEKTYFTWYSDFSDVVTLSDSALAAIPLASDNVVYRPGSRWIKVTSDPKTYAVSTNGTIRWIETEAVASGLAGSDWSSMIEDVSDSYFGDYTLGTSIMSAELYDGALASDGTNTYLISGTTKRLVSSAGMTANRYQTRSVLDGSGFSLSGFTAGTGLTAEEAALIDTAQQDGVVVTTDGGLSVSLASTTPASATVPDGADSVPFTTFKLTATDGAVTIDQMVVNFGGVASTTNVGNVYLYEGNTRLTNGRSVNSTTRAATFSSLDLEIASGASKYITLRADTSYVASDSANFYLASADSIVTDATVSGSFPISGNNMTFSDTNAGTLTVTKNGTVNNPTLGEEQANLGKFQFAATTEGASLFQVAFDIDQALDHSNYKLYQDSAVIANGTVSGDTVTFALATPVSIEKGGDETLTVKADIGGQTGETLTTYIKYAADVMATGAIYGFNMNVNVAAVDYTGSSSTEAYVLTLQGGDLTFVFNGPTASDIAVDSNDVTLMEFAITASNWVELQNLQFDLTVSGADTTADDNDLLNNTSGEANYTDITVRKSDGTVWMGPEELDATNASVAHADDQTQNVDFTDYQTLQAGDSLDLILTVDIDSDTDLNNDVVYAVIDVSEIVAEDANGDALAATDIVPSANITGHNMTVTTSALTVDETSTPTAGTFVIGTTSVSTIGYSFTAGEASDIEISDATFIVSGDSDATYTPDLDLVPSDHVSSCSLYDSVSGSLVDGPIGINASSTDEATATYSIPFEGFSWTVEAGESAKLVLKCDLSLVALDTTDAANDTYKFYLETTDGVPTLTVTDEDGDSVDGSYDSDGSGTVDASDDTDYNTAASGSPTITVAAAGSLTVARAADAPVATIALGNSTGVSVAKYKFTATNEAFVVNQLQLVNSAGATYDRAVNSVTLSYTNSDGATETKTGYLTSAIADFGGLDLYVPTTESRYLTVMVDTNTVSSTGATSGDTFDLDIDMLADTMQAVGAGSGTTVYSDTGTGINGGSPTDINGSTMTLYKTKPTMSLASGTPDGAATPGSSKEALRFNIAVDSRGYITVEELAFQIDSVFNGTEGTGDWNECWGDAGDGTTNADGTEVYGMKTSNFTLYKTSDLSDPLESEDGDWTLIEGDATGTVCEDDDDVKYVVLDLSTTTDDSFEIAAGVTETFSLYITTTGASTSADDGLQVTIPLTPVLAGAAGTDAGIIWVDDSASTELGDTYVKSLPLYGGVLVY